MTKLNHLRDARTRQEGFTLVELLIVILIIGILATIAIPIFNGQRNKAKDGAAKSAVRNALSAVKSYATSNDSYQSFAFASLGAEEQSLTGVGGPIVTGQNANPQNILVTDSTPADGLTGINQIIVLCSASTASTNRAFCITDNIGAAVAGFPQGTSYFFRDNDADASVTAAEAGTGGTGTGNTAGWR